MGAETEVWPGDGIDYRFLVDPNSTSPEREAITRGTIPDWVRETVLDLDFGAIADEIVREDMRVAFPSRTDDRAFTEMLRASVVENLRVLRNRLTDLEGDVSATIAPPQFAAEQARLEMPSNSLQASYRTGISVTWQNLHAALSASAGGLGLEAGEALHGLRVVTLILFEFHDAAMKLVSEAHAQAEDELRATQQHRRQRLLREVIDNEDISISDEELSNLLHYDVRNHHLAAILHRDPGFIRSAMREMIARGAGGPIAEWASLAIGPQTVALWLGRHAPWTPEEAKATGVHLAEALGDVSLGTSSPGTAGLRQTYMDATAVERVRKSRGLEAGGVLTFADVQLDALALSDRDGVKRFVFDELGPLAVEDDETDRLRETLVAWYETGSNVSAAAILGIHEHTVRNRLRRSEELLGHSVTVRRLELQTALRLFPMVAAQAIGRRLGVQPD